MRYIARYTGRGAPSPEDIARIRSSPGLRILDESGARMLLVDADESALRTVAEMPSWTITEEKTVPLPDTRRTIRSPSSPA